MTYETAAEALLALAVSQDGPLHNGDRDDPIRRLLYLGAEACQRVDQAQADREAALHYAAELRSLLEQAVGILEAEPLPVEGGVWDGYVLAYQARELLRTAPLAAGRALRQERHATRLVARAATPQTVREGVAGGPLPPGAAVAGDGEPVASTHVAPDHPEAPDS